MDSGASNVAGSRYSMRSPASFGLLEFRARVTGEIYFIAPENSIPGTILSVPAEVCLVQVPQIGLLTRPPAICRSPSERRSSESERIARMPFVLKIVLRVFIVGFLVIYFAAQLDYRELTTQLNADLVKAALALQLPMLIGFVFYSRRHAILVRSPPIPLLPAAEAVLLSATLNLVIPGRLSEAIKAVYLRSRMGVPLPSGLSAIMIERLYDLGVVGAIASIGIVLTLAPGARYLLALPFLAIGVLVFIRPICNVVIAWTANTRNRAAGFIVRYCRHILEIMTAQVAARTLALTAASWLAHFAGIWLFFQIQPFGQLSIFDVSLVFGAMIFAGAIPALPAGLGLFEAAIVVVLQPLGFEFHQALAVGIALHGGEILMAAVLGPMLMLYRSIGVFALMRDAVSMMRKSREEESAPTPR